MEKIAEHIVTDYHHQRIADYLVGVFHQLPTKSSIKKALKAGRITLNGQPAATAHIPAIGSSIAYYAAATQIKPYPLEVPVAYEDDHLVVVNKPPGLPTSGNLYRTLEASLAYTHPLTNTTGSLSSPRPAHRLDSLTSGLVIMPKTPQALFLTGQLFEQGNIQKTYQALVMGATPDAGLWDTPIDGKTAVTTFQKRQHVRSLKNEYLSLLELTPKTGRTHQLRIHCSQAGFPIYGDPLYAGQTIKHKGLFLCATRLCFAHPITSQPLDIQIDLPTRFINRMHHEQKRWDRRHAASQSNH